MALPLSFGSRAPARDDVDRLTVDRAAAGDDTAFESLVLRYQREVYTLAFRLLGERDDALEAAQDTFLRVHRALPRFRGDAMFRTWLIGIAINVCRNRIVSAERKRRRLSVPLVRVDPGTGEAHELTLADPTPGPEAATHAGELRRALLRALQTLSPEHREILLLREMSGLEYDELASALGCALGTVKSRMARARAALRQALEGVWP